MHFYGVFFLISLTVKSLLKVRLDSVVIVFKFLYPQLFKKVILSSMFIRREG